MTRKIISFALNIWDSQWVNRQQLLSRLGQTHKILYSNGGWFTWDRTSPQWRLAPWFGRFEAKDNVLVDTAPRGLMRNPKAGWYDRWVIQMLIARWKRVLGSQFSHDGLAYVFHPALAVYAKALKPQRLIYHAYDLFRDAGGWNQELDQAERWLLEHADLVIASSEAIADTFQKIVPREVRFLPNGVDYGLFVEPHAEPSDLASIPHPRLGYTGSLHPQIDYGLAAELAAKYPSWHFVFVGGHAGHFEGERKTVLERCRAITNIHFLGEKPRDQVPAYLQHMDVNLMLYLIDTNIWTNSGYPLKLHEYLAAGRPIVTANLPAIRPFHNVLAISCNQESWEQELTRTLSGSNPGNPEKRRAVARENSWDARVATLKDWLEEISVPIGQPL